LTCGLIGHYRSADLTARIVHDEDPSPAHESPIRLDEPALR
jgi:hypothetical protein